MLYTGYSYEIRDVDGDYDENGPKRRLTCRLGHLK